MREAAIKMLTYPTTSYKEGFVPPGAINWNDFDVVVILLVLDDGHLGRQRTLDIHDDLLGVVRSATTASRYRPSKEASPA